MIMHLYAVFDWPRNWGKTHTWTHLGWGKIYIFIYSRSHVTRVVVQSRVFITVHNWVYNCFIRLESHFNQSLSSTNLFLYFYTFFLSPLSSDRETQVQSVHPLHHHRKQAEWLCQIKSSVNSPTLHPVFQSLCLCWISCVIVWKPHTQSALFLLRFLTDSFWFWGHSESSKSGV